ncbi:IMPACT family protein [Halorussus aquaticus]|uniref:IMPACT family protein n=1 Tax=Halorussus aquaticus TaxID=2953748 RepID=A0ABD5Q2Q4_9EURY|nr:YigZ family protein [Halorussus aquaticus]
MGEDTFRTVAGRGRAAFEIRGSEFVGHAAPAADREAAEAFVAEVRAEYDDATHNVPAYRVRESGDGGERASGGGLLREWADDDGEPSGSAGKPALNVLQQEGVENVVAVVTRYYGGTNLGVGGLARSYSRGVKDAIEDAGLVEERPHERFSVAVEYDDSGTVRGILESADGAEFDADYAERVAFAVRVPVEEAEPLRDRIRSATSGRADIDGDA